MISFNSDRSVFTRIKYCHIRLKGSLHSRVSWNRFSAQMFAVASNKHSQIKTETSIFPGTGMNKHAQARALQLTSASKLHVHGRSNNTLHLAYRASLCKRPTSSAAHLVPPPQVVITPTADDTLTAVFVRWNCWLIINLCDIIISLQN